MLLQTRKYRYTDTVYLIASGHVCTCTYLRPSIRPSVHSRARTFLCCILKFYCSRRLHTQYIYTYIYMRFYILRALCSQGGLGSLDSTWHFGTLAAFQSLGAGFLSSGMSFHLYSYRWICLASSCFWCLMRRTTSTFGSSSSRACPRIRPKSICCPFRRGQNTNFYIPESCERLCQLKRRKTQSKMR